MSVPALVITPDDTIPSAVLNPNERITRIFRVCNTGNADDAYLPTRAHISTPAAIPNIYFDIDNSGTVTPPDVPVQIGSTLTPRLAPATCLGVIFVIETNAVAPTSQVTIGLTARSTIASPNGGFVQDNGTIINSVGAGVVFSSLNDPNVPPQYLINGHPQTIGLPGQILDHTMTFRNSGTAAARHVLITDDLPASIEYGSGTLYLNGRNLTDAADNDEGTVIGRRISILIPYLEAGGATDIRFQTRVGADCPSGSGYANLGVISAENVSPVNTSNAVVVMSPVGTIYSAHSGGLVRINGAEISIATDEIGTPLALVPGAGYPPNVENINPFQSDSRGGFGFIIGPGQIGSATQPVRYFVTARAPYFKTRHLEVLVHPEGIYGFYHATVRSLDGQPISAQNSFSLSSEPVELDNLAAFVFNIPMFDIAGLEISKTSDKRFAEIGDIVSYRIQVKNATSSAIHNVTVHDSLPPSFVYASGTTAIEVGSLSGKQEPAVSSNELAFDLGEMRPGMISTISYRVRIGASSTEGDHTNSAVASGIQPNGATIATEAARSTVRVRGGIFSMAQVVIGRVFEDLNGNGQFDAGERPVAGARIYVNNGQSVVTDSAGLYNLPTMGQGAIVLSLDPITLPTGYELLDDKNRRSSRSWTRLLRTPIGGGALLRQNFAVGAKEPTFAVPNDVKMIVAKGAFLPASQGSSNGPTPETSIKEPGKITNLIKSPPLKELKTRVPSDVSPSIRAGDSTATITVQATEKIVAVPSGGLVILSPKADEVVMTPALSIQVRVAINWSVDLSVNTTKIDARAIGETRVDNRNQITTYSFVGISLLPGENQVSVTAINGKGEKGRSETITVFGRGPVEKLKIVASKTVAQAGGRDPVDLEIRAVDRWGNPAMDGQVSIETSAGSLFAKDPVAGTESLPGVPARQRMASLENGVAVVQLLGDGSAETATLKAIAGLAEATSDIRFTADLRPTLLVGMAEMSFGRAAPEISSTGDDENMRGRLAFYYRGRFFGSNLLTLAYDSQRSLNRIVGRDRVGGIDPLDRSYPIFGDSSARFEDAESNSKVYFRFDHGRTYFMFGDMEADLEKPTLSGYNRRLTGAKLHLENSSGDFISLTGARPNTAFARDVIPGGGLSVVRLSKGDILAGSEVVFIEVRDRRNPEIVISRENLIRSVDYNLDPQRGELILLRQISTFDVLLNLVQIVITYEYNGAGGSNYVYTGRAYRNFKRLGLSAGASYVNQQQEQIGAFQIGGFDLEKTLPLGGRVYLEAAMSRGRFASGVSVFDFFDENVAGFIPGDNSREHNGIAYRARLEQPLPFFQSKLKAEFQRSSVDFFNPFGTSVSAGNHRLAIGLDLHPGKRSTLALGFSDERNKTTRVNNSRQTISVLWSEQWRDNLRSILGFDHRHLADRMSNRDVDSNLITFGIEYRPTTKIELAAKREQNLSDADPTYPSQTILAASYQLNQNAKLFFTQRLASAAITPISDTSGSGFASSRSRRETAFGIESKIPRFGALSGKYQMENGANGVDTFAVIGLQNRWRLNKQFSIDAGFERGFLMSGAGKSFTSATFGGEWVPVSGFRAEARYELRDKNGMGQMITIGAAGKIGDDWTALTRAQWSRGKANNSEGSTSLITAAIAYRPIRSDRYALLFSFKEHSTNQTAVALNGIRQAATHDRADTLSSDGLFRISGNTEVYGRFALRFNGNGDKTNIYASSLTYSGQFRLQQRINDYLDLAAETRWLFQPASDTRRTSMGAEVGYWLLSDLRFGFGYNFTGVREQSGLLLPGQSRRGCYFVISSKLSNLFDLFGTSIKEPSEVKPADKKPDPKEKN
ncbi:MAG: hypothetical protein ABL959_02045 [Pyrinomonadaceae bacterium]